MQNTEEADKIFNDIQSLRDSLNPNNPVRVQKQPGENKILENIFAIEAINKRMKVLEEQIRTHPLDFMSILVWEVQLEKLGNDAEHLQKQNQKLSKSFSQSFPASPHTIPKQSRKVNPLTGYAPISMSSLAPNIKTDFELKEIQNKLNEVYERKDFLFMEIQNSATGIADPLIQKELDEITQLEASIVSKLEEIQLSKEANVLMNTNQVTEPYSEIKFSQVKIPDSITEQDNNNTINSNSPNFSENEIKGITYNNEDERNNELNEIQSVREEMEEIDNPDIDDPDI